MGLLIRLLMIAINVSVFTLNVAAVGAAERDEMTDSRSGDVLEMSGMGEAVSCEILDSLSGGQSIEIENFDMLLSNMQLSAQQERNVLYSTNTGVNIVGSGAFSSANGISTVIQNSGNQVIINSALILNLLLK